MAKLVDDKERSQNHRDGYGDEGYGWYGKKEGRKLLGPPASTIVGQAALMLLTRPKRSLSDDSFGIA